jgi:magnesium transporter
VTEVQEEQLRLDSLVEAGDVEALIDLAGDLHPSDVADLVEGLERAEDRIRLLGALPVELASETLAEMEEGEERAELLAALEPATGAELLHELADDDAADLIGELEPEERQRLLDALPVEEAGDLRGLLLYDEETAGGLMTTDVVAVVGTLTAQDALEQVRIQGREVEDFYTVFVVDERYRLLGTVRLDDLVIADADEAVENMVEPVSSVLPDLDQEEVGRLIARYNLAALPVVNEFGVLLGRITFDDVIDVIEAEQTEDILRLAGVTDEDELRHDWASSVRTRLPWLMLNLLTASLAASVILLFEDTIDQVITLAFIAPIIAAMGGSSGTQSLAVTIRRITVEGSRVPRGFVGREILIGLVNGGALGLGMAGIGLVVGGDPMLGVVVLLAMWGNQVVAGFAGAFIPTALDRMGIDPSVASSVFVHTLTDLCGFFLLLGLATRLLL